MTRPTQMLTTAGLCAVLMLVPVALLIAGCGGEAVGDSGVQGEVRIGPVNPVERPDVPNDAPYVATLRITRASGGRVVAEARSAADGTFRVALPAGDYVLEPVNGNPLPVAVAQDFTVQPGRFTNVRVDYDSGIR
jgi:hypothetical protein